MTALLFLGGLALLIAGGELLVRGASALALRLGMTPLVVGLTVVAFGTSAPELAVSVGAAWSGTADVALGNVVGSNIFNVLFILGAAALVTPLAVSRQLVIWDAPIMLGVSVALPFLALDGGVGRLDGLLLAAGLAGYIGFAFWVSRGEAEADETASPPAGPWGQSALLIVAGLGLLVLGAGWLVDAAVSLARALGLSELVIGLTIVAAGTSLPEVVTSIIAAYRGQRDIAVGNVVGSCIFNILAVLGIAAVVAPAGVAVAPAALAFDIPVMIAVAAACLPIFFTGHVIARWEGALFLFYYAAYTAFLILKATEHDALPAFSGVMAAFVLPLTAATLAVLAYRALRRRRAGG
ncbi:MAG: calcium/sodium antiporter [Pseudomonadota bacterium]